MKIFVLGLGFGLAFMYIYQMYEDWQIKYERKSEKRFESKKD